MENVPNGNLVTSGEDTLCALTADGREDNRKHKHIYHGIKEVEMGNLGARGCRISDPYKHGKVEEFREISDTD